jgi:hypothetical protein
VTGASVLNAPHLTIAIAATIFLVLIAVAAHRKGYTIISVFVAAAAWLSLAAAGAIYLVRLWGV